MNIIHSRGDSGTVATDLNATLLPDGPVKVERDSIPVLLNACRNSGLGLIYVTGNALPVALELFQQYNLPLPEYFIGNVGTSIFRRNDSQLQLQPYDEDTDFADQVADSTPGWSIEKFRRALQSLDGLMEQEDWRNNALKLSYYTAAHELAELGSAVKTRLEQFCSDFSVVISTHGDAETGHQKGYLDILPTRATKAGALRFLMEKLGITGEEVVFSGDSGNDLDCLSAEWRSTLVRNASPEVRAALAKLKNGEGPSRIHYAEGLGNLNGYYSEGIIEGLIVHGFLGEGFAQLTSHS
ncbi:MAG: HAD-IIB family hydrolase [Bdellovibrionales bacterium]|nr:HAD-IIB family hydrolase [Bdellovibrionales bacterium]